MVRVTGFARASFKHEDGERWMTVPSIARARPAGRGARMAGLALAAVFAFWAGDAAHAADAASKAAGSASAPILILDPWVRPTLGQVPSSAAYMIISNRGRAEDVLVSLATPASRKATLHESLMQGGVMRMRPVRGGLRIPAGKTVKLAPGGLHVMLMGLTRTLRPGETIALTLRFEKAGPVTVRVPVRKSARRAGDHGHGMGRDLDRAMRGSH